MERYERVEGTSAKFWEARVTGTTLTVRFGRLGTRGQSRDKTLADEAAAVKEKSKLVREKTAKGYARTGEAQPVPEEGAAPAGTTVQTPGAVRLESPSASQTVFEGASLPTRLRPGRDLTADEARQAIQAPLQALLGEAGCARQIDAIPPPDGLGDWATSIVDTVTQARTAGGRQVFQDVALRRFLEAAMRYGVAGGGTMAAARLADRMRPDAATRSYHRNLAWAEPLQLALRAALVHAPEADYDAAVAFLNQRIAETPDWATAAAFAFILADDRPPPHALQPLAVLEAASAAGIDILTDLNFLPLVVDADPISAAPWRIKRYHFLVLSSCALDASEAAATLIAVASCAGQPALPGLDWLMHYALDGERTAVARAMLSTDEPEALSLLLPHLHEKPVAAALDAALAADPARTIPRCLAALPGGRAGPALRARVVRALDTHGLDAVRGWLGKSEGRAARFLDGLVEARAVAAAERAAWPRVLRDPPWRVRTRNVDGIVLDLVPLPTPFVYEETEVPENDLRGAYVLGGMSELPAFVEAAEADLSQYGRFEIPPTRTPPPTDDPDALLVWLGMRLRQIDGSVQYWPPSSYYYLLATTHRQPEALALTLWSVTRFLATHRYILFWPETVVTMLSRFGKRAVPGLVALLEADPIGVLPLAPAVDAAGIAPPTARALSRLKTARAPALAWLRRHRHTAITRLVPDAVGARGRRIRASPLRVGPGRRARRHRGGGGALRAA